MWSCNVSLGQEAQGHIRQFSKAHATAGYIEYNKHSRDKTYVGISQQSSSSL